MDKQKGQYFTISKVLQDITVSYIEKSSGMMLEPSFGRGDLVNCVLNKHKNRKIIAVELDNNIKSIVKDKRVEIHYMNFIDYDHINIFSTIYICLNRPDFFILKNLCSSLFFHLSFFLKSIDLTTFTSATDHKNLKWIRHT